MVSAEVHAHIAPSPKASVLHGSERIVERYLPLVKMYNIDSATLVVLR